MEENENLKESIPGDQNSQGVATQEPGETSVPTPGATTIDKLSEQSTSNRDTFFKNLKAKYGSDLSEEELYAKAMEGYDGEHEYNKLARENDEMLRSLAAEDPDFAGLVKDFTQTGSMAYASRNIPEGMDAMGEEGMAVARDLAKQEREQAIEAEEQLQRQQANVEETQKVLTDFVKSNNMSEEEAQDFMGNVSQIIQEFSDGVVRPEFLMQLYKGKHHDENMKMVEEATKVAMRNTKINEQRQSFKGQGDGLSGNGKGSGESAAEEGTKSDELGWLKDLVKRSQSVI